MRTSKTRDYYRLIQSDRWRRLRRTKIMASPYCEVCGKPATEVHHLTPVETMPNLQQMESAMFDMANLQSLCHKCHVDAHRQMHSKSKATNLERRKAELEDWKTRHGIS
jgi:5-methylcytosine-specific restriction protein A